MNGDVRIRALAGLLAGYSQWYLLLRLNLSRQHRILLFKKRRSIQKSVQ